MRRLFVLMTVVLAACGDDRVRPVDDDVAGALLPWQTGAAEPAPSEPPPSTPPPDAPPDVRGRQKAPVVLMHGMAGFERLGPAEYFYGVVEHLRKAGVDVHITVVDPFQSVEIRAKQAAEQLDRLLQESGARKVHLVGHSQGGLDARHLVSVLGYGDRVATLTTIGTPHRGTKIADVGLGLLPGDSKLAVGALADVLLAGATRRDADLTTQLVELTAKHARETFNPAHPDDPRVEYFSVVGVTQPSYLVDQRKVDVVDELLRTAYNLVWLLERGNDGLVPVSSQKWGRVLGEIQADHLDQMGWLPLQPQPAFEHKAFYLKLARFLTGEGPAPLP